MGLVENILKKVVLENAIITEKVQLSDAVFKIRIQGESIKKATFEPGYFLRFGVGIGNDDVAFKDKVRSYSVWNINQTEGYLDLAIATESNGLGAQWVKECKVNDVVYYKWKKGNFLLDPTADSYLMIGDLSALSHLYMINRNLPPNKQLESIVYSQHLSDLFEDADGAKPFNFHTLEPNAIPEILKLVKESIARMKGNKIVYIAGDSRVCIALNSYFRNELHWNTTQIKTKPFWNPDKKGLE